MAKKKKKQQASEDLIDQLLEDVQDVVADDNILDQDFDADAATVGHALFPPDAPEDKPVGLEADAPVQRVERTQVRTENLWESLDADAENSSPGHKKKKKKEKLDPIDFPFAVENAEDEAYNGPSLDGNYQSMDDIGGEGDATRPIAMGSIPPVTQAGGDDSEDRTVSLAATQGTSTQAVNDHEPTVAADGFAIRREGRVAPSEKVAIGSLRGSRSSSGGGNVFTSMDASLAQAENLKIAQARILELEKENDRLRQENDEVSSAADIIRSRLEELNARITSIDKEKVELQESMNNEIMILKGNLQYKESEVAKARLKIDELETRLRSDFKKIRVKERELENRLELARAEKAALIRAKDENILELKRKTDQQQSEIDNYRDKLLEMNRTLDANQEQFKRTVRALRLALANLEVKDENVIPIKKAE